MLRPHQEGMRRCNYSEPGPQRSKSGKDLSTFPKDSATIPQTFQLGSVGLGPWEHGGPGQSFQALIPGSHLYFFFLFRKFCWVCAVTCPLPSVPVGLLYCSLLSLLCLGPKSLEMKSQILGGFLLKYSPWELARSGFWGDASPALGCERRF